MNQQQIFSQVEHLARGIRLDLRKKGFAIPCDNGDGTISVESYTIVKEGDGFYSIRDFTDEVIVGKINLPQTAAILANNLALGRWLDEDIVEQDRKYGYNLFEETLSKQQALRSLKKKDIDRADLMFTQEALAKAKKLTAKKAILSSYEKLKRL